VHGIVSVDGKSMKVKWSEEDTKHPRFSEHGVSTHLKLIKSLHMKFFEDQEKVKERMTKYASYGNVIKPQLSQKIVPPPTVGEDSGGGERSWTSTPILPFPHHKGEGDEIGNNDVNIQNHC